MDSPGPWPELATSPWGLCLNWLCTSIIDLSLADIKGNVWIRDPLVSKADNYPIVLIGTSQPSHNEADGTVTAPDILVAAQVGFVYGSDGSANETLPARLAVHHLLFNALAKRARPTALHTALQAAFPTVGVQRILCRPGDPSSQAAREANFAAGWMEVQFHLRYPSTA